MNKVKLSSKGQLVIPQAVRERHGWDAGTVLVLEDQPHGVVVRPLPRVPETALEDLVGCTGYQGPRRSLREMQEAIAKGARETGRSS